MSLQRQDVLRQVGASGEWDVVVVGGGATGLGTAVEAASRGYRTILFEAHDFAKCTSSRSTKLIHGGVRYLQQGNLSLVREALRERGRILRNAPHLAHWRSCVIPVYKIWQIPFYAAGLTAYDLLAGRERFKPTRILSVERTREALPTVCPVGLKGGVRYYDGQFDDTRFAITLLRTLFDLGGAALNYAPVTGLLKGNGAVKGVFAEDTETNSRFEITAKVVINATGVFADAVRRMDDPQISSVITASQGTHVVLPRSFLPGDSALMIPRTADGRVLFAIPWHDRVLVGTTDNPVPQPQTEPRAMPEERQFLTTHLERFLDRTPQASDILSVWSGQRPLVRRDRETHTAALSRDHTILISGAKLVTIVGGKWTTYRKMAEDVMDRAAPLAGLAAARSRTAQLRLHGWTENTSGLDEWEQVYGADAQELRRVGEEDSNLNEFLHPALPFRRREIVWAARHEMARTIEDVLARRTRALFLDAKASMQAAPIAAEIMARELGRDAEWEQNQVSAYRRLAEQYLWS